MSFRSACDPHAYGARGWTSAPDVSIQVFQEPAVGSTGLTPVQIHGPVGIGPVKTASDPSFWPWTTTMRPTMWPKFRPLTTTPGVWAWTEAARAVSFSAMAPALFGNRYVKTSEASPAATATCDGAPSCVRPEASRPSYIAACTRAYAR